MKNHNKNDLHWAYYLHFIVKKQEMSDGKHYNIRCR